MFSRATGYLPYLETPKGRFPFKPLADCRPDPLCLCSYVRVVEDRPGADRRSLAPCAGPGQRGDDGGRCMRYFTITPDGKVRREVRIGTPKIEDFNDPANVTVQELALTADGIAELSLTKAARSNKPVPAVAGAPVRRHPRGRPAVGFKFDDGLVANRGEAREMVNGTLCPVAGNKALWKKGVSGTALAFDGYFSKVELPKAKAPALTDELTVEAWVALGAYPWNDAGIVHCSAGSRSARKTTSTAIAIHTLTGRGKWKATCWAWIPTAGPFSNSTGEQVGGGVLEHKDTVRSGRCCRPTDGPIWRAPTATAGCAFMLMASWSHPKPRPARSSLPDRNVLIGLNGDAQRVSDPVSHSKRAANNNLPLVYGIEGLIDEVRIHAQALSADEIRSSFEAFCPPAAAVTAAGPGTAHPAGHGHRPAGGEIRRILRDAEVSRAVGQPVAAGPVSRHRGALRHAPGPRGVLAGDQFRLRMGHREQQVDGRSKLGNRRPARLRRAHGRQARAFQSCPPHRKHRCPRGGPLALRVHRCGLCLRADRRLGGRVLHDLPGRRGRPLGRGHQRRLARHAVPLRTRNDLPGQHGTHGPDRGQHRAVGARI